MNEITKPTAYLIVNSEVFQLNQELTQLTIELAGSGIHFVRQVVESRRADRRRQAALPGLCRLDG